MKKRALISVFDKTGIEEFARELASMDWELISSSGTSDRLRKAGLAVTEVADVTGYPSILGGRVKTLHPMIFGGILARRDLPSDVDQADEYSIPLIDMVVCNLYPFEETARRKPSLDELLDNIDIGGVSLLRAGAKNYRHCIVLTDPSDYGEVLERLRSADGAPQELRERLALKAFLSTSMYDGVISAALTEGMGRPAEDLPSKISLPLEKVLGLRYGENPHQKAALYLPPLGDLPWEQISGKPLSYNNILDTDCALRGCALFEGDCGAIVIKHTTPSGMACGATPREAYEKAVACDPVSAFGGVVGISARVDGEAARAIGELFTEVLLAPNFDDEAVAYLAKKQPSLRVLRWKGGRSSAMQITGTWSGLLMQQDSLPPLPSPDDGRWIGTPRPDLWEDLLFAWKVAALSKSNAIALVKDREAVGIGRGFCSRLHAVDFAVRQGGDRAKGSVMGSDAFFPFPDGVEAAAAAGVTAIIQPGGSIKDPEVFQRAGELGVSMFISGNRTFRH